MENTRKLSGMSEIELMVVFMGHLRGGNQTGLQDAEREIVHRNSMSVSDTKDV